MHCHNLLPQPPATASYLNLLPLRSMGLCRLSPSLTPHPSTISCRPLTSLPPPASLLSPRLPLVAFLQAADPS